MSHANNSQPSALQTRIEQYYEALYMFMVAKPGTSQETFWKHKKEELADALEERH